MKLDDLDEINRYLDSVAGGQVAIMVVLGTLSKYVQSKKALKSDLAAGFEFAKEGLLTSHSSAQKIHAFDHTASHILETLARCAQDEDEG